MKHYHLIHGSRLEAARLCILGKVPRFNMLELFSEGGPQAMFFSDKNVLLSPEKKNQLNNCRFCDIPSLTINSIFIGQLDIIVALIGPYISQPLKLSLSDFMTDSSLQQRHKWGKFSTRDITTKKICYLQWKLCQCPPVQQEAIFCGTVRQQHLFVIDSLLCHFPPFLLKELGGSRLLRCPPEVSPHRHCPQIQTPRLAPRLPPLHPPSAAAETSR